MKKVKKYFVKFFSPGIIVAEIQTKKIKSLNPYKIKFPDHAYSFTLNEREDVIDEETGKEYLGKDKQVGPRYYHPDSKVETLEEVKKNRPSARILISNLENNNWHKIIWSRWGNWPQPFDPEKDVILSHVD